MRSVIEASPLTWKDREIMDFFNSVIAQIVANGVSVKTVVLLLLLPLVASIVAATRHLIGFRGFGILIPTIIAVTFAVAGIETGLLLFLAILVLATLGRRVLRGLRLHYLPRMALLLWLVNFGVLAIIYLAPFLGLGQLSAISIFPIVILILLAEEFIAVQIGKSSREAIRLTAETLVTALIGYFIFSLQFLREWALRYPHWILLVPVVINIFVGRFTGLRLLEYRRFRELLK
jgi:hypothetical protein